MPQIKNFYNNFKYLFFCRKPLILPQPDPITGEEIEQFCMHRCPELDACINASLWCDGTDHCPSGYDEALTHCSIILQLPIMYLLSGTAIILISICLCCAYAFQKCKRRRRSILQTRLKSLSSDTQIIDEKEVICWHSDNSVRYVEVDRVTTVWQQYTSLCQYVIFWIHIKKQTICWCLKCLCFYNIRAHSENFEIYLSKIFSFTYILECEVILLRYFSKCFQKVSN